jgi:hypothetical protein
MVPRRVTGAGVGTFGPCNRYQETTPLPWSDPTQWLRRHRCPHATSAVELATAHRRWARASLGVVAGLSAQPLRAELTAAAPE